MGILGAFNLDPRAITVSLRRPLGRRVSIQGVVGAERRIHRGAAVIRTYAGDPATILRQSQVFILGPGRRFGIGGFHPESQILLAVDRAIWTDAAEG